MSPITSEHLKSVDLDSTAEELMYIISNPNNGDLALKMHLERTIQNFTQAHIDAGAVVFVHRGNYDYSLCGGCDAHLTKLHCCSSTILSLNLITIFGLISRSSN